MTLGKKRTLVTLKKRMCVCECMHIFETRFLLKLILTGISYPFFSKCWFQMNSPTTGKSPFIIITIPEFPCLVVRTVEPAGALNSDWKKCGGGNRKGNASASILNTQRGMSSKPQEKDGVSQSNSPSIFFFYKTYVLCFKMQENFAWHSGYGPICFNTKIILLFSS